MAILTKQQYIATMVIITVCVARISTDIYTPLLPTISEYFGVSGDLVQSSIAASFLGSAIVAPFTGITADYFGKRPILLIAVFLFVIGSLVCAISPGVYTLISGRFIQGCGVGAMAILAHATIQDHFGAKDSAKIRSILGFFIAISLTVAPIIGSRLDFYFNWRAVFVFITIVAVLIFIYMLFDLTKKPFRNRSIKSFKIQKAIKTYRKILTNKNYLVQSMVYPFMLGNVWCYSSVLPYYLEDVVGMTTEEYSYFQATITAFSGIGPILSHFLINKFSLRNVTIAGISMGVLGSFILLIAGIFFPLNIYFIATAITVYILGTVIVFAPTVSLALQIFPKSRNSASAMRNMLRMILSFVGGFVASAINDHQLQPLAIYMVVTSVITFLLFFMYGAEGVIDAEEEKASQENS